MNSFAKLYLERVIEKFLDKFLLTKSKIDRLIIISPWITTIKTKHGTFNDLLEKIKTENIPTHIVTRTPITEKPNHINAIEKFKKLKSVEIIFNNELHAKLYVCDCGIHGFAMLCSANLTLESLSYYEIGVMIYNKDIGENIFRQLRRAGLYHIRTLKNNKKIKKIGEVYK